MNTDPIADMLTRIRNANTVSHATVEVDYEVKEEGKFKVIVITLKYEANGKPVITKLQRVSKPGLRHYSKAKNLEKVLGGMGIAVVSTPKGLLTDRKARKENVGGEVLCYVY